MLVFLAVAVSFLSTLTGGIESRSVALEKVTKMLAELLVQVKEQGKTAAEEYDEFACMCKREADDTIYRLERTEKEQERLESRLRVQEAERDERQAMVNATTAKMNLLQAELDSLNDENNAAKLAFANISTDFKSAIYAVDYCITELQGSLSRLSTVQKRVTVLGRYRDVISAAIEFADRFPSKYVYEDKKGALSLVASGGRQSPHAYQSGLGEIIKTLQFLRSNFKAQLSQEEAAEVARLQQVRDALRTTRNSFIAARESLAATEKGLEANMAQIGELTSSVADAAGRHREGSSFLLSLKNDCQSRAAEFDEASESRREEIAALSEAHRIISSEAVTEGFKNNLDRRAGDDEESAASLLTRRARRAVLKTAQRASLIQINSRTERREGGGRGVGDGLGKGIGYLSDLVRRSDSSILSAALLQAETLASAASSAPFEKVTSLIKGLISQLESQLAASLTAEESCKADLESGIEDRNSAKNSVFSLEAELSTCLRELKDTKQSMEDSKAQMQDLNAALVQITTDHHSEKARLDTVIQESRDAMHAVVGSIDILANFYNVDISGFKATFVGSPSSPGLLQGSAKGGSGEQIISLLQVIATDFKTSMQRAARTDEENENRYNSISQEMDTEITFFEGRVSEAKARKSGLETRELSLKEDIDSSRDLLSAKEVELAALKEECVNSGLSYDEKVKRRREEIKALKETLEIIRSYKPATA